MEIVSLGSVLSDPEEWVPNKRTYPESCDFEFCHKLMLLGISPNFTRFNPEVTEELLAKRRTEALNMETR